MPSFKSMTRLLHPWLLSLRGTVREQIGGCQTQGTQGAIADYSLSQQGPDGPAWRNRRTLMPLQPQYNSPPQEVCRCALVKA